MCTYFYQNTKCIMYCSFYDSEIDVFVKLKNYVGLICYMFTINTHICIKPEFIAKAVDKDIRHCT